MLARARASTWRSVAVWLLMLVMLLGPLGTAFAANDTCTRACPCAGENEAGEDDGDCGDEHDSEHRDAEPEDGDDCTEDCRTCCASLGIVLTRLGLRLPAQPPPRDAPPPRRIDDPIALGVHTGVFRPPR
jgi:hypothetical protein